MMIRLAIVVGFVAALGSAAILPVYGIKHIDAWGKANGYPYGKMCHSIFTLYKDECK